MGLKIEITMRYNETLVVKAALAHWRTGRTEPILVQCVFYQFCFQCVFYQLVKDKLTGRGPAKLVNAALKQNIGKRRNDRTSAKGYKHFSRILWYFNA